RDACFPAGFDKGPGVVAPVLSVKIRCQEMAGIICLERVYADGVFAGQVSMDRQIVQGNPLLVQESLCARLLFHRSLPEGVAIPVPRESNFPEMFHAMVLNGMPRWISVGHSRASAGAVLRCSRFRHVVFQLISWRAGFDVMRFTVGYCRYIVQGGIAIKRMRRSIGHDRLTSAKSPF
ncbi:MAG: hypothetical protein Q8O19_01420, partial [Rectinemataceae bacterium]|nr:hypothetical protein [Rectinemataceae bacterium]